MQFYLILSSYLMATGQGCTKNVEFKNVEQNNAWRNSLKLNGRCTEYTTCTTRCIKKRFIFASARARNLYLHSNSNIIAYTTFLNAAFFSTFLLFDAIFLVISVTKFVAQLTEMAYTFDNNTLLSVRLHLILHMLNVVLHTIAHEISNWPSLCPISNLMTSKSTSVYRKLNILQNNYFYHRKTT